MRKIFLSAFSAFILGLCVYHQADGVKKEQESFTVKLNIVDAETGERIGGIVRVYREGDDSPIVLTGLYDRLKGLKQTATLAGWHVVPAAGGSTSLPKGKGRIEAVSGLETVLAREDFDFSKNMPEEVTLKVRTIFRPEERQLIAGNTHLHLMKITQEDADEYLKLIPAADRLKVMFISYLERFKVDEEYITNRYAIGELKQFNATGVLFNNGEEHRHNFEGFGQGYGHVMFLNINQLVKPVSIGPGISGAGNDERPLKPGIEEARMQGGTIIWCHNTNGFEKTANALAGRLDALNVFDGSRTGSFEDGYYRYLNIGLRLPLSTGTDWFMYDFARVYANVPGKLSVPAWLEAVKAGRCQATNGPLLSLTADGKDIGHVENLDQPKNVNVELMAIGRHDFQSLQLIHNGKVIQTAPAKAKDGVYTARIQREVRIEEPAWFTARIDTEHKNELDKQLFAHTSPIYVDFKGKRVFDVETARVLLREMEEARDAIKARGKFNADAARDQLLAIYDETAKELKEKINKRGK